MAETRTLWNDRFSWSSEIPGNYPGLNPSALARFSELAGTMQYTDGVDSSRVWTLEGTDPQWYGMQDGPRGPRYQINGLNPETEQSRIQMSNFSGLWPTSGRVLVGGWFWQRYIMQFCPLIDTRATDPFVYLSTNSGGVPRHQVFDSSGSSVLDQQEYGLPWLQETEGYFLGMMVDDDANTSQMFSVHNDGRTWIGPARSLSGSANFGSTANAEVYSLRHADYYESGEVDEITVAHPSSAFDLEAFVEDMGLSVWANGQQMPGNFDDITVTDDRVVWDNSAPFDTGAERVSWQAQPSISTPSGELMMSTDDGSSWSAVNPSNLPEQADGALLRRAGVVGSSWSGTTITIPEPQLVEVTPAAPDHDTGANTVTVSSQTGVVYSPAGTIDIPEGGTVTVTAAPQDGYEFPSGATTEWAFDYAYPDPPTLGPIPDVVMEQGAEAYSVELSFTAVEPYTWSTESPTLAEVAVDAGVLSVEPGFEVGTGDVTVTLSDQYDRSVSQTFEVTVDPLPYEEGAPPRYPHAPIVLWDDDGPVEVLIDPLSAVVTKEVNGAHELNLIIPADHQVAHVLRNERVVEVAGERYRIRRITSARDSGVPVREVYAEARFYDLSTAGQINAREWTQVMPGDVMAEAVSGTGWSIGAVNVGTRRTYSTEDSNPLELLRTVQENHGGDLLFDNDEQTVSLVVRSGQDKGVSFFYGKGLSESSRVVDTTSLVTRIYPRNADGETIASVNGGREYVEDYSFTDEVRTAVYDFKSGTSPYTMLSMANATIANRSRPDRSYEVTVEDLSAITGEDLDRFDAGDYVTVVDPEMDIAETQRVVKLEYDVVRPWSSGITLSATLRELGSSDSEDSGVLTTGASNSTLDMVPFNLLRNARFDNALAHWAHSGAEVVDGSGTGDYAVRFEGGGYRWIEQTVTDVDARDAYTFSFDIDTSGLGGESPDVRVEIEVEYEDGDSEVFDLDLS